MEMSQTTRYWFKRRRYGWGWVPVTWQGWLTFAVFAMVLILALTGLPAKPAQPSTQQTERFFGWLIIDIACLLLITALKSPTPRWRWGKKHGDNPDEDF